VADDCGFLDGFQAGGSFAPFVFTRNRKSSSRWPRLGNHSQEWRHRGVLRASHRVDVAGFAEEKPGRSSACLARRARGRRFRRGERAGSDLIEERLKEVKIAAID